MGEFGQPPCFDSFLLVSVKTDTEQTKNSKTISKFEAFLMF